METEPELFDMIIPPGVPRKVIADVLNNFEVTLVSHTENFKFANMDNDRRQILAFRGKKEVIDEVFDYVRQKLEEFISS